VFLAREFDEIARPPFARKSEIGHGNRGWLRWSANFTRALRSQHRITDCTSSPATKAQTRKKRRPNEGYDAAGKNHAFCQRQQRHRLEKSAAQMKGTTQAAKTTFFAAGNKDTGLKKAPQATFFQ
jgi:hypothetical protein